MKIPVVVILGHIDHGKSSLLEAIKKEFKIIEKEAGGITQHIGAYGVDFQGKRITFVDTPGHEVFSEMRARGAKVADLAILVVAADEGVKPQTKEAISAIQKADIPMIVCINKVDKPNADPQRLKSQLQKEGLLVEEFGGKVPVVETSAKTGQGINELLEMISLLWEMSEKKVKTEKKPFKVQAFVIEGYLDSLRGPTATLILENGELKAGDIIGSSSTIGKIKTLEDFKQRSIEKASPGEPVIITGFEEVPALGENFRTFNSLQEAQAAIEKTSSSTFETVPQEDALNVILKTDVKGTLEVIEKILSTFAKSYGGPAEAKGEGGKNLANNGKLNIVKAEVGSVNFSDLKLSEDVGAKIISFRAKVPSQIKNLAQQKNIEILAFEVIYDLIDNIRKLMEKGRAKEEKVRQETGRVKILICFKTQSKKGKIYHQIIGGKVIEGKIKKGEVETERENKIMGKGKLLEVQKERKKIEEGRVGQEIGMLYEGSTKIKEGDILIAYQYIEAS